jgi:tRNA (guanine9-N1)-methyltransferase
MEKEGKTLDQKDNETGESESSLLPSTQQDVPEQEQEQLSKNQMKKRKRLQKKLEINKRRKQQEKEQRNAKALAEGRDLDAERKYMEERTKLGIGFQKREAEWLKRLDGAQNSFRVCIDCSFENLMTPKEIMSLSNQIRYCYSANKNSPKPIYLSASNLPTSSTTYQNLSKVCGFPDQWSSRAFTVSELDLMDMFKTNDLHSKSDSNHQETAISNGKKEDDEQSKIDCKNSIDSIEENDSGKINCQAEQSQEQNYHPDLVYLSSDSTNILSDLDDTKTYIIGGIVDRNRHKGITHSKAQTNNIQTAKLPIDQYLTVSATKVLTVNHVFEILLEFRICKDWKEAFLRVLPERKDVSEILE